MDTYRHKIQGGVHLCVGRRKMGSGRGVTEGSASSIMIYLFLKDLKQDGKMIGFNTAES